jgi:hypothetical protein
MGEAMAITDDFVAALFDAEHGDLLRYAVPYAGGVAVRLTAWAEWTSS